MRPSYLRSLSAADPQHLHILALEYRGFGLSSGSPSETGLITDGIAAVDFALNELGIPPDRIALVGQSLGTAVTFAVAEALARRVPKVEPRAVVSLAGFADMESVVMTYKIAGVVPVLSPLNMYPIVQKWFVRWVRERWDSVGRVKSLVRNSPNANLIFAHAKNVSGPRPKREGREPPLVREKGGDRWGWANEGTGLGDSLPPRRPPIPGSGERNGARRGTECETTQGKDGGHGVWEGEQGDGLAAHEGESEDCAACGELGWS